MLAKGLSEPYPGAVFRVFGSGSSATPFATPSSGSKFGRFHRGAGCCWTQAESGSAVLDAARRLHEHPHAVSSSRASETCIVVADAVPLGVNTSALMNISTHFVSIVPRFNAVKGRMSSVGGIGGFPGTKSFSEGWPLSLGNILGLGLFSRAWGISLGSKRVRGLQAAVDIQIFEIDLGSIQFYVP
ncbi:hypothetical protein VUR80DRAFT_4718 [Thermomyces stellatus]